MRLVREQHGGIYRVAEVFFGDSCELFLDVGAQSVADVEMFTFDCEIHVRFFSNDPFGLAGMEPVANDRPRPIEDGETAIDCQAIDRPKRRAPQIRRILVIRLSALGDFIMALPAMAAIRAHHPAADITLLTSKPLAELGKECGWFDRIEIDTRPRWHQIGSWLRLRRTLRGGRFDRVYDLQSQDRTAIYFRLFWPGKRPEWSGIAPGASHPHTDLERKNMHAFDIHAAQLCVAGIAHIPKPDLSWLDEDVRRLGLPSRIALLVPGSAPHRPAKRWPTAAYGALASVLVKKGITPVVIGTADERPLAEAIRAVCPKARDLTGQTSLFTIAGLARRAVFAVGSDTGPMHLIAIVGCRVISLFSAESNPERSAPRGDVTILQRPDLAELTVGEVADSLVKAGALS
jgi:ADP-heptose:LPS heptosyltransferase